MKPQPAPRVLVVRDVSSCVRGGVATETPDLLRGRAAVGQPAALMANAPIDAGKVAWFDLGTEASGGMAVASCSAIAAFQLDVVQWMSLSSPGLSRLAPVHSVLP